MRIALNILRAALLGKTPADLTTPTLETIPDILFLVDFPVGRASLTAQHIQFLSALKERLRLNPRVKVIRIIGYASETGGSAANEQISRDRALSVASFLGINQSAADAPQIQWRGSIDPLEPSPEVENPLNRRVAIYLDVAFEEFNQSPIAGIGATKSVPSGFRALVGWKVWKKEDAVEFGQHLDELFPGWKERLPACPLRLQDARADPLFVEDTGAKSFFAMWVFHQGAAASFRSLPGAMQDGSTNEHYGQQCTYDERGDLIAEGAGAGTPDLFHSELHRELHWLYDVDTWHSIDDYELYNTFWVPNKGPEN